MSFFGTGTVILLCKILFDVFGPNHRSMAWIAEEVAEIKQNDAIF